MKRLWFMSITGLLGTALAVFAQAPPAADAPAGRGRGGAPLAWGDKDKDGICDITGRPVGQGRATGAMRAGRGGRCGACGRGAAMARGRMGAGRQFRQPQPAPPPAQQN